MRIPPGANPGCAASPATESAEPSAAWKIWVSGYGEFDFEGTEAEAEEMRAHKARWERGQGRKWRADLSRESDRLTAEIVGLWSSGHGVPMRTMTALSRARVAEAGVTPAVMLESMAGRTWASTQLAALLQIPRVRASEMLQSLKRQGRVRCAGQLWTPIGSAEGVAPQVER